MKNQAFKRPSDPRDQNSMEQNKKGKSSVQLPPPSKFWTCNNPACRATQSTAPSFCKRCSCCICHQFDDNKDPSLWLECVSEFGAEGSCGFSCHIECALQDKKVGAHSQLDGGYSCAFCGKVSSIIGCWKKQLKIAMDAHRVDDLCSRIFLSYRLLDGTSRFKELHNFIEDLKAELEMELGPINEAAAEMSRRHAGRLNAASDVQKLCRLAIQKAEELPNSSSIINSNEVTVPSPTSQDQTRTDTMSDSRFNVRDPIVVLDKPEALAHERLPLPDLNEELPPYDTTNRSPLIDNSGSGSLDDDFENIVKTVRELEHGGHVSKEFRLKFFTWFSLRSSEHERRVVRTFVKTMIDDPSSLGGQLVDTFSDIVFRIRV